MAATVRIVPQGEILKGAAEPPAIRLADPASFFSRPRRAAARARRRAATGSYLELMAELADAQQAALDAQPHRRRRLRRSVSSSAAATACRRWQARRARAGVARRAAASSPAGSRRARRSRVGGIGARPDHGLRRVPRTSSRDRILAFDYPGLDARVVPFVGAALQVHWVRRAAALGEAGVRRSTCRTCARCAARRRSRARCAPTSQCPAAAIFIACCAARTGTTPRGHCTQCEAREKLAYFHIEGGPEVVKAEACDECRGYLKIVNQEKDPLADPVADDLATLALDVLMDESGYERASPNLLFVPGQT